MGIFDALQDLLREGLIGIHESTGLSWAWSIIALTAVVRVLIMPITVKQTRSMLAMQRLQPYVKQLQQRYKDDRQLQQKKLMEFYRDNRVNPLASCLPLLIQLPIFFALFLVLRDFADDPPAQSDDFSFLWGFVENIRVDMIDGGIAGWTLLLFYVASQMLSSRVMATTPDPRQRMLFMLLPVAFVPFVINFPIGVMLYWITTNLWTLGQHLVVVRFLHGHREVVLPEDTRGNKKVVVPKAEKAAARERGQGGGSNGTRGGGQHQAPKPNPVSSGARRNKRRR